MRHLLRAGWRGPHVIRPACGCLDGFDPGYVTVVDMYAGRYDIVAACPEADLERLASRVTAPRNLPLSSEAPRVAPGLSSAILLTSFNIITQRELRFKPAKHPRSPSGIISV